MTARLDVHLYGSPAATLEYISPSDYRLTYFRGWQEAGGTPLSLSLPLTQLVHTGRVVSDFIDNLLPDSTAVREEWARQSGLPDAESFGLLAVHGADVAGALEFYPADKSARSDGRMQPVSDTEIAARIRAIRENRPIPTSQESGPGQFSLGGAQGKFALARRDGRWFDPTGIHPSTHIFKPQVAGLSDAEIVEHVTMTALPLLGLPAASTEMVPFADEHTLQVERFDRFALGQDVVRIHQEDFSQALGVPRLKKYEKDGGPNYRQILKMLDRIPDPTVAAAAKSRFVASMIFSWFALNTDAHSKNYSLRLLPDTVDLTPLYDVSSFLPYVNPHEGGGRGMLRAFEETKLSMRVAQSFEAGSMGTFEWASVARDAKLDPHEMIAWARNLADAAPRVFEAVARLIDSRYQTHVVDLLLERISIRGQQVKRILGHSPHV